MAYSQEQFDLFFSRMEMFQRISKRSTLPLKDFLMQKFGVDAELADALILKWEKGDKVVLGDTAVSVNKNTVKEGIKKPTLLNQDIIALSSPHERPVFLNFDFIRKCIFLPLKTWKSFEDESNKFKTVCILVWTVLLIIIMLPTIIWFPSGLIFSFLLWFVWRNSLSPLVRLILSLFTDNAIQTATPESFAEKNENAPATELLIKNRNIDTDKTDVLIDKSQESKDEAWWNENFSNSSKVENLLSNRKRDVQKKLQSTKNSLISLFVLLVILIPIINIIGLERNPASTLQEVFLRLASTILIFFLLALPLNLRKQNKIKKEISDIELEMVKAEDNKA